MHNFENLTEFNPAIIYSFETESSPEQLSGSIKFVDCLFPQMGQHLDMLNAYLYAQDNFLPILRANGPAISKEQLIEWIKTIHKLMGKTLLGFNNAVSGEYSKEEVVRWHNGAQIHVEFAKYLAKVHDSKTKNAFANYLLTTYGVEKKDTLAILAIINKVKLNTSIPMSKSQMDYLNQLAMSPLFRAQVALNRLIRAYQLSQLSIEEKQTVEKLVKICMPPENIPAAMDVFAEKTLARFAECNPDDHLQIARFLAETFYELTEIHPFPNGNGRTATGIVNLFLRYFNLPSILLRYPDEKHDKTSLYAIAISSIDSSREPLAQLILSRFTKALTEPYANPKLQLRLEVKLTVFDALKKILSHDPDYNIDGFVNDVAGIIQIPVPKPSQTEIDILVFKELDKLTAIVKQSLKSKPQVLRPIALSPTQKTQLITSLEKLSGHRGWKLNPRAGIVTWFETKDESIAKEIEEALKTKGISEEIIKARRRDDASVWVVKCDQVNFANTLRTATEELTVNAPNVSMT